MAVALQSSQTTAWASATTVVITKPSGLAVGDLLIALIGYEDGGVTVTGPAGWTAIRTTTDNNMAAKSFYIIATSTEVAATNFTFTASTTVAIGGAMLRIDGHSAGNPIWTSNGDIQDNDDTPTFADTVTPAVANSMIIFWAACKGSEGTIAGWAIATSNPSWTEVFDFSSNISVDYTMGGAYAIRSQTTATGDSSFTHTSSTGPNVADWRGQLIVVPPSKDFTQSDSITETDSVFGSLTAKISESIVETDLVTATRNNVQNIDKNSATWQNIDKTS